MVNYFTIMVHKEILQCYVVSQIFTTQVQSFQQVTYQKLGENYKIYQTIKLSNTFLQIIKERDYLRYLRGNLRGKDNKIVLFYTTYVTNSTSF